MTLVPLSLTVWAQAGAIVQAEPLQGQTVGFADGTVDFVERLDQAVVLELNVLQMGSQVGLAVRNKAGQAGFESPAWTIHARVTHHISSTKLMLLWRCFFGSVLIFRAKVAVSGHDETDKLLLSVIPERCWFWEICATLLQNGSPTS